MLATSQLLTRSTTTYFAQLNNEKCRHNAVDGQKYSYVRLDRCGIGRLKIKSEKTRKLTNEKSARHNLQWAHTSHRSGGVMEEKNA